MKEKKWGDINLQENYRIEKHMLNKEKIHELKVGNINIEMCYSKNNKKIYECMLNVLNDKVRK